ncbi:hypothetical protein LZD49_26905 [Dyadobacter sp. CY261]|uniref:hypothetical protein n=1 Tax=Dyadobacter sp. CY261 TaxID=2907203 RepID=UPI001F38231C|nr:hypothetical protein [Dyadobacter sp. CY261]MCF0074142.1 hypothetical protein [Dyadobacter sp. CY261]
MIIKITKWLLLIIAFKMTTVLIVAQYYTDPRRDTAARKKLCSAFNPNVVFIGTSRTLYGIDPAVFDSVNQQKTRSYNFGIFSLSPYSSTQIADDILSGSPEVKTIYMELSALDYSTVALQPRQVIQDAVFRANVMADCPNIDFHTKAGSFLDGLNTTLFQMVSIAPQILSAKKALNPNIDPIEGNATLLDNGHQSVTSALLKTSDRIIANKSSTEQMLATHPPATRNTFYVSQLNKLIARARKVGRKVIFYCPNNITRAEYQILSQVIPFLPDENLIPLPEHSLLDVLFKSENLFDAHHLNRKGAAIYTRYLQEEAGKRIDRL